MDNENFAKLVRLLNKMHDTIDNQNALLVDIRDVLQKLLDKAS